MEFYQKEKEGSPQGESYIEKEGYKKDKGILNGFVEMEKRQER